MKIYRQLDVQALEYENGTWDCSFLGKMTSGRHSLYAEPKGTISFKEEVAKIKLLDVRAVQLEMACSDYVRRLVDRDIVSV